MTEEGPTTSFVLSLIGGILILVIGLLLSVATLSAFPWFGAVAAVYFMIFGVAFGSIVLIGAIMLYEKPEQHVAWGVIVLVFSVTSLFSTGGLLVGFVLGIVGGALGIAWKPLVKVMPQPTVSRMFRYCPYCRHVLSGSTRYCTHCGREV